MIRPQARWTRCGIRAKARYSLGRLDGRRGSRRHLPDAHLAQRIAHRVDRKAHLAGPDRADAAHAKRLDLRELARIENEALVAHALVEVLERVSRIRGSMEGDDDRRLNLRLEEGAEAELRHSGNKRLAVCRVARK